MVCSFVGHREVYDSTVEEGVCRQLDSLLKLQEPLLFYTGGMGHFDAICSSWVRRAQSRFPHRSIRLVLVLPYLTSEINHQKKYYETRYDEIILPEELVGVHYKSAIQKRNRWMVDRSDVIVSWVRRPFGGAFQTLRYAQRKNKKILPVNENLL